VINFYQVALLILSCFLFLSWQVGGYTNCYTGNLWDTALCPTPETCTTNCEIDGVPTADWSGTYGGSVTGNKLNLKFVTQGPYSKNVGSRTYLLDSSKNR
jgi:cellulose 1,4-beta-cellobiosidase